MMDNEHEISNNHIMKKLFRQPITLCVALLAVGAATLFAAAFPCDNCERFKGRNTCWECCRCQNTNCIDGCKNSSDYNACVDTCSTAFENCNKSCK